MQVLKAKKNGVKQQCLHCGCYNVDTFLVKTQSVYISCRHMHTNI